MIVLDTSVMYALVDRADAAHREVAAWYRREDPDLVTTPLVVAEADHLIGARLGARARDAWWDDLARGAYLVDWWAGAIRQAAEVARRWADLALGLTDASLVVLADHVGTLDIATLDQRHTSVRTSSTPTTAVTRTR